MRRCLLSVACIGSIQLALAAPAFATFHLMQIEQVIGGVNGDTAAQAIQLRMRTTFQNQVSQGRLIVRDATGSNPVTLIDFTTNVTPTASGTRILIATAAFARYTSASITPDFTMANPIPATYLAAGSLTFEQDTGTYPGVSVLWRLSWGGASFTGTTLGSLNNDSDGNFGSPIATALPSTNLRAINFPGAATAGSTTNLADYSLTAAAATFRNSAGASAVVSNPTCTGATCKGDSNNDNRVDGADVTNFMKAFLSGNAKIVSTVCSDMDSDGAFTAADVTAFAQKVLGISDPVPACP